MENFDQGCCNNEPKSAEKIKLTKAQSLYKDTKEVLVVLIGFMLLYILCFRSVIVVGSSMFDTLADGDRLLLISNMLYAEPKQGDIVVVSKDSFRNGECFIKRVIATEGQIVDIDFNTGTVYVDGQPLEEDYLHTGTYMNEGSSFPVEVEEGCVFVMGDNRMHSQDSRSPRIGQVDEREILGRAILLMWPGTGVEGFYIEFDLTRIGGIR